MSASCVRADRLRADGSPDAAAASELAKVFCAQARLRVDRLFDALWDNADDADRTLAKGVLAGRYTFVEGGVLDPSEGTGPWIMEWEPGPSASENLARRYLPPTR